MPAGAKRQPRHTGVIGNPAKVMRVETLPKTGALLDLARGLG
jgi:hypothetical protein